MVTLNPVPRALVPIDSDAAQALSSPNYDEFQGDREIFDLLRRQPASVLRITMPHAVAEAPEAMVPEGGPEALQAARSRMAELRLSPMTRTVDDTVFVYEIVDPARPGVRQIGLGGLMATTEIVTDERPSGTIVRNEGIRPRKARGRADLIRNTEAIIGAVNLAVEDSGNRFAALLEATADRHAPDFSALAEDGCRHLIRLLPDSQDRRRLLGTLRDDPCAYVADGNHRSAAAAMVGLDGFLAVVFPASRMGLAPYNRLVCDRPRSSADWCKALAPFFEVGGIAAPGDYQPSARHRVGLYAEGAWMRLTPRAGSFDPGNAAESIDAAIVQRNLFEAVCGIADPRDGRLTFVGGDRDATYLRQRVDEGTFSFAVTLPAIDMKQFLEVCRQRRMMPPKSTWFSPKIRSGLVMALLD